MIPFGDPDIPGAKENGVFYFIFRPVNTVCSFFYRNGYIAIRISAYACLYCKFTNAAWPFCKERNDRYN